jgi:hypothetical protein
VAVGDLDGDSFLDVVTANSGSGNTSVLLGDGSGSFGAPADIPAGDYAVALGDVNGDTVLDVVVSNYYLGTISVALGDGSGGFGSPASFATGSSPVALALGDLDGDDDLDVVTADYLTPGTVSVLLGDGSGSFGAATQFATGGGPRGIVVADLSGDGDLDVLTSNGEDTVSVLLGNGLGGFGANIDYATGDLPQHLAVGDLNGDSHLDVVTSNYGSSNVSVLLGSGSGVLAPRTDYPTAAAPRSIAVSDLNGDSFLDVVTSSTGTASVSVLLGIGSGSLLARTDFPTGSAPWPVAVGDLDADSRPDVVAGTIADTVSVLMNTTGDPVTVPSAPTMGLATGGNQQATVSWTAPVHNGGAAITEYVVTPYVGGVAQTPIVFSSSATTRTITGLVNGTEYTFTVAATNSAGTGPESDHSNAVTPAPTPPGPPTIGAAVAGDSEAIVSWTAPASDGGSPIIGYVVTPYVGYVSQGPRYFVSTSTTQTVGGLANGITYRFRVRAWNAIGVSGFSTASNAVTPAA